MELREYKEKKEKVIEAVKLIRDKIVDESSVKFLDEKIKSLENHKFVISVFGHFSNGKSTFLNALMGFGEEVLAESELASTATITRLRYPDTESLKNKAEIIFKDGTVKVVQASEIKNYSARNNQVNVEYDIAEVILYLESEILKDGVEIVDTPGFNSTHGIHTDIAKAHVANSDASIFLFSYEKPGSKEELNFLKEVNDKMDRIFLVLNKIDKEDKTESTIDDTIRELKSKINDIGADVKSKEIHPISAMLEKVGIAEGNSHKREYARVLEFKKKLADYLTSEDNVRDRLESPIKSILSRLNECREFKKDQFEIYSSENDKLEQDIKRARTELEELVNELKERKNSIRKSVKAEINNARSSIDLKVEDLEEEIDDDLKDVKSSFALRVIDFEDKTDTFDNKIKNTIHGIQKRLVGNIEEIIDSNIDNQQDYDQIKDKLINAINVKLNFEGKNLISMGDMDKSYFNQIDEKIEKKKEELNEKRLEWERLTKESCNNEELRRFLELDKKSLERLKEEKRDRLLNIGDGQAYKSKGQKEEFVSRRGLFGKVAQVFVGKKSIVTHIDVLDESEIIQKRMQKSIVENEYEKDIKTKEELLRDKESKLTGDKSIDIFQREAEIRYKKMTDSFYDDEINFKKERFKQEQELVDVNVRKYKRSIKEYISDLAEETKISLDVNASTINKIVEMALISSERKIEIKNEVIENLIFAGKISPEELDMKINEISEEIVILNKSIVSMRVARESVI